MFKLDQSWLELIETFQTCPDWIELVIVGSCLSKIVLLSMLFRYMFDTDTLSIFLHVPDIWSIKITIIVLTAFHQGKLSVLHPILPCVVINGLEHSV